MYQIEAPTGGEFISLVNMVLGYQEELRAAGKKDAMTKWIKGTGTEFSMGPGFTKKYYGQLLNAAMEMHYLALKDRFERLSSKR